MNLDRYLLTDPLARLELENFYHASSAIDRIEITKKFNNHGNSRVMPRQWGELTLKHGNLQERIALARYWMFPDDDLKTELESSPDILVRCALLENPEYLPFFVDETKAIFKKGSQAERIAIVRNIKISDELILQIYDLENSEFSLTIDERKEVVFAFCQNERYLEDSKKGFFDDSHMDGLDAHFTTSVFPKLWDAAYKWIEKEIFDVPSATFKAFACHDEDKILEIYKKIKDKEKKYIGVRYAIFASPLEKISDTFSGCSFNELYREALTDTKDWIREVAASRIAFNHDELSKLVAGNDKGIIKGLLSNKHLNRKGMALLQPKINELGLEKYEYGNFYERFHVDEGDVPVAIDNEELTSKSNEELQRDIYKDIHDLSKIINIKSEQHEKQIQQLKNLVISVLVVVALIFFLRK